MNVVRADRSQDGLRQTSVAGGRSAVAFVAARAHLDRSTAIDASQNLSGRVAHWLPAASTTSSCRRMPTSLPSEVVIGELSRL